MQERTLVLLSASGRPLEWLTLAADGRARARGLGGPPPGAVWTGLLAAPALSVRWLNAPQRGREKWRQAARFALEDQVADDLEQLHVALPERIEAGPVPVAVVNRTWFAQWLAEVRAQQLAPQRVLAIAALIDDQHALTIEELSTLKQSGVGCTIEHELLAITGADQSLEPVDDPLIYLASRLRSHGAPELLSGTFAAAGQTGGLSGTWRWAALLLLAALAAEVGQRALTVSRLRAVEGRLEAESAQILEQTLGPGTVRIPGSERQQLKNELDRRSGTGAGTGGVLGLLGSIGPILGSEGRVKLKGLEYREQRLELLLEGGDVRSFDVLRERFASVPGLKTEVGDLNYGKATVTGRIRLERVAP